MSYQDTFLEDCSGWIKSNIRIYTNQYFPNSEARETRRTLRDLKCPFCQQANATIHLVHDRIECACMPQTFSLIQLVQIIEPNPIRSLEQLTGLTYFRPAPKKSRRR